MSNNFRLSLWIFMTFICGYMLLYTLRHDRETWKTIALGVLMVFGLVVCFTLYNARKNDD